MKLLSTVVSVLAMGGLLAMAEGTFERDTVQTSAGELVITCIGHGTLMLEFGGKTIHVDPCGDFADYATLPKADLILLTHHHGDHLDPRALGHVRTDRTAVVLTKICARTIQGGLPMEAGDARTVIGIPIAALPAYNVLHERSNGVPFHPKGEGIGYILTFGDTRVYIAGDTENTAEMKALKDIDVAFLPMNLPYTMTPEMVADAARAFRPSILYPYHYGSTDPARLVELLRDVPDIEVRVRKLR